MSLEILVVDDDTGFRRSIVRRLREDGFVVAEDVNGVQALAHCERNTFDVVLTDWEMPKMNGDELCRELKQMPEPPAVAIMSGGHSEAEARQAGADMFTHKTLPTSYERVLRFLDHLE